MAGYVGCKEKSGWRPGVEAASAKAPFSPGPDSDLNQAHLAYVARAEIKMSILSFSFVQLRGQSRLPLPVQFTTVDAVS